MSAQIAQIVAFGGAISGTGTLVKNTAAIATTLTGDSTAGFTGGVQVLAGTLSVQTPGAIGTGTINDNDTEVLTISSPTVKPAMPQNTAAAVPNEPIVPF